SPTSASFWRCRRRTTRSNISRSGARSWACVRRRRPDVGARGGGSGAGRGRLFRRRQDRLLLEVPPLDAQPLLDLGELGLEVGGLERLEDEAVDELVDAVAHALRGALAVGGGDDDRALHRVRVSSRAAGEFGAGHAVHFEVAEDQAVFAAAELGERGFAALAG